MKEDFGPFFFLLSSVTNLNEHFIRVYKVNWHLLCKSCEHFFGTKEVDRNKHFKNSCFHDERNFWPIFPCNIECDKSQWTTYNGPQAILAITLEVDRVDRAFL